MKIKVFFSFLLILFLVSCSAAPQKTLSIDIDEMVSILEENAPSDFGYCDVTEYYWETFFKNISGLKNYRILKCNESTNFNEFGVFEFINSDTAKKSEEVIRKYLSDSRYEFENGIIYNASEYPKFKNSTVKRYNNFVIYTILRLDEAESAYNTISNHINIK